MISYFAERESDRNLYYFAKNAMIKYHRLDGLNNRNLFYAVWRLEVQGQGSGGFGFF